MTKDPVLVLFSGGKDSFLAASRLAMAGTPIILISFNNGSIRGEQAMAASAGRLENRYGRDLASYAGCYSTFSAFQVFRNWNADRPWSELGREYPNLYDTQVTCLLCQTAMWSAAIAYSVAKGISRLASGYKKSDPFCTGWTGYCNRVSDLAGEYGKTILWPVWNDDEWQLDQSERNHEMARHGFDPAILEPACTLGRPAEKLSDAEQNDMARCLDENLMQIAKAEIERLIQVLRAIRLSDSSAEPLDFGIPDGSSGLF